MNTMGILAQGIILGDGAVATYLDVFKTKDIGGGLFHETTRNSYRRKNFDKNNSRMSSYYHVQRNLQPTDSKRLLHGNLVSAYNVDGIPIGYAYTTDINDNTLSRGYTSSADFEELQRLLREKSIDELFNGNEDNFTFLRYKDIESLSKTSSGITPTERGGMYYERLENYRRNHGLLDSTINGSENFKLRTLNIEENEFSSENQYKNGNLNASSEIYKFSKIDRIINNRFIEGQESIEFIADSLRPKKHIINDIVLQYGDLYNSNKDLKTIINIDSHYGEFANFYEKLVNKNEDENRISFSMGIKELVEHYKEHRDYLLNNNISTIYYQEKKSYGVSDEKGKIIKISKFITSGGVYEEKIIENNEGSLISFNHNNLVTTYNLYDESDNDVNVSDEVSSEHTTRGTSLHIKNIGESNYSRLLSKTNELFKNNKIKTLVSRFHTDSLDKLGESDLITAKTQHGLSRGRNLLKKTPTIVNGYHDPYCRVWTSHHQYSKMEDLIRPFTDDNGVFMDMQSLHKSIGTDLRPNNASERIGKYSVLQSNGFLKITPTKYDDQIKNYMFSIENLAWKDFNGALSKEQLGPNKGRIMWFPPYNLKFNENINVSWNDNNFIGRGEKIYTYTNTERSGTLSFTLLIDHPSLLNKWRGTSSDFTGTVLKDKEDTMLRFFAGCEPLTGNTNGGETVEKEDQKVEQPSIEPQYEVKKERIAYVIFFPNNYTGYDKKEDFDTALKELYQYEMDTDGGDWNETYVPDESFKNQTILESNLSKYGLNNGSINESDIKKTLLGSDDEHIHLRFLNKIVQINGDKINYVINNEDVGDSLFKELKANADVSNIEVRGFASSHGKPIYNEQLAKRRADFIKKMIKKKCDFLDVNVPFLNPITNVIQVTDIGDKKDMNTFEAKIARSAMVIFNIRKKIDSIPVNEQSTGVTVNGIKTIKTSVQKVSKNEHVETIIEDTTNSYTYDNEYIYFKEIGKNEYFIKSIVNRIKHFDPAYHSITPEGFNARLTFLQQCTRQGPTTSVNGGYVSTNSNDYLKYAGNLSFGRAPYCILRIGDFFNTKILIDSISIDYDNGGGTQWDLNPEGIGVQPMMANVNLNFKFIGGQDISGPVERLQNAVTSNYYANASIYDSRADYMDVDNVRHRELIQKK